MFATLSPQEQRTVISYFQVDYLDVNTEIEPTDRSVSPMASGCWTESETVNGYNSLGVRLWRYESFLNWCGDGVAVTSTNDWRQVSTPGWWWSFEGDIDYWTEGGVGWSGYRVHRQGEFQYCPYSAGCIQHEYPWTTQFGGGNGYYSESWGG